MNNYIIYCRNTIFLSTFNIKQNMIFFVFFFLLCRHHLTLVNLLDVVRIYYCDCTSDFGYFTYFVFLFLDIYQDNLFFHYLQYFLLLIKNKTLYSRNIKLKGNAISCANSHSTRYLHENHHPMHDLCQNLLFSFF